VFSAAAFGLVAFALSAGCSGPVKAEAPALTRAPSKAAPQARTGPMPLLVGDSVGVGVYTTRASLASRGIDPTGARFASGEPTPEQ
jgi:hypothetical protein